MIEADQLEGGCQLVNQSRRWFVYTDRIAQPDHSPAPADLADDYRALTERHSSIAARYRSSADNFAHALGNYRDIIGQTLTPDDLSSLDDTDPTG
jgi:hypothetical protein